MRTLLAILLVFSGPALAAGSPRYVAVALTCGAIGDMEAKAVRMNSGDVRVKVASQLSSGLCARKAQTSHSAESIAVLNLAHELLRDAVGG